MARLTKYGSRRPRLPIIFILSLLMLGLAIGLFIIELTSFTQREDRLPAGITVADVRVGGLTLEEAAATIEQAYTQSITLYYQDSPILLAPDTVGFRLSIAAMLAEATAASEQGGGFWARFGRYLLGQENVQVQAIPLIADYQQTALEAALRDISTRYDRPAGRAGFDLATLTTFQGDTGFEIDLEEAVDAVDAALRRPENRVVELPLSDGGFSRPSMDTLQNLIIAYLDSQGFIYDGQSTVASIFIMDLVTGEEINILSDVAMTAASTTKVPILIDYFGELDGEPTRDDAWLMANSLLCSQNSTSNLIMQNILGGGDQFVGIASVTNIAQYLGAENTFLTAPYADGSPNQQFGSIQAPQTSPNPNFNTSPDPFNQTTAEDMGVMFSLIYDCAEYRSGLMAAFPEGDFSQLECQRMLNLMSANDLQRLLQGGLPEGTRIAHKNGWLGETAGDAGIVFSPEGHDYVISVFLWEDRDENFQDFNRLWTLIEEISRATWNYFNPEQALLSRRSNIPVTAQECWRTDASGNRINQYLPPYELIDLDDINGWREGRVTTETLVPAETSTIVPTPIFEPTPEGSDQ